jgi:hypothetical protein
MTQAQTRWRWPAPARQDASPSRDVLTASVVSAAFGVAWALFGAGGLPAGAQAAVRGLGILIGLVIIVRAMRLRRTAPVPTTPGFRSRQYRAVVAAEAAALVAGLVVLPLTGNAKYLAAWFAVVVGVHFVAFGRFFSRMYYALGAVVTAGGVAAALVGVAGGSAAQIGATAGLVAAASLFTAAAWRIFPHRPSSATRRG